MNIVFNWSGTISDDSRLNWNILNQTLEYFKGEKITFDTYINELVLPVEDIYLKYCPNESVHTLNEYFIDTYISYEKDIKLFNGIPKLIQRLYPNNTLYILSSLDAKIINSICLEVEIFKYFKTIIGNSFNKKEALENLLNEDSLVPSETMYLGDIPNDIESAKILKVQSGGVTYGHSNSNSIISAKPDYIFNKSSEIWDHFIKINQIELIRWPIVTVGALIFNENNQVLLIQTNKWSDLYGTPGGKVEYGESLEAALIREIKEETNLYIKDIHFIFYQDCIEHPEFHKPRHFLLMNFIARVDSCKVSLNYESDQYRWEKINDALSLPLNEPTQNLILKLQNTKQELFNEYNFVS